MKTLKLSSFICFLTILAVILTIIACNGGGQSICKHQWEYVITKESSENEEGLETETCALCNITSGNTKIIPKISQPAESVYISGWHTTNSRTACYWKDDVRIDLSAGDVCIAYSITVSGDSVYVAGLFWEDGIQKACYWKDGVRIDLSDGVESYACSIAVSDGSVYIAGEYYLDNGSSVVCY